jgi:uncharacterized protein YndB with AHSA1/START domain
VARNSIRTRADPEAVFDVLDDACAYPRWVVGARRVRAVDPSWPAPGSHFRHALGTAVGELHDSSKVLEHDRPRRIVLEVRFRPTGVAKVEIRVSAHGSGSTIVLEETPTGGLVSLLPRFITDPLLTVRNALALQRLRHEVERSHEATSAARSPAPRDPVSEAVIDAWRSEPAPVRNRSLEGIDVLVDDDAQPVLACCKRVAAAIV